MIRSISGLPAALGCLLLAGCFAPSDPAGPPVGLRVEQGTLVVYLPLCPGERVLSGQIDDPDGDGKMLWRGEQPSRPRDKIVRLGSPDWGQQTGAFSYDGQTFTLDVDGTARNYGGGAVERKLLADLPPGTYDLSGKKVTAAEIDQKSNCEKSG